MEVRGEDGGPPYVVEWSDGHTGLLFPGPGSVLHVSERHEDAGQGAGDAAAAQAATDGGSAAPAGRPAATGPGQPGHVREWTVRVSIYESGDDTHAQAVLLGDSPQHLKAEGDSHRAPDDPVVPEIGDEVAAGRALRHLAERLLVTADDDIAAVTGEDAHVRRS
ncbi:dsRBD fold-containing protein [Ornithinimicrobium sp. CNJ-824]|uniref:dsRBD fold-containing protein n=1 Tax=Ornithinimicrobium sp. CNJ-824 TaxID=1904966 RepID=UPI000A57BFDA|nr:dsRBD fold-containing protein [Ornithinimicrobium sp. CNJ-824]